MEGCCHRIESAIMFVSREEEGSRFSPTSAGDADDAPWRYHDTRSITTTNSSRGPLPSATSGTSNEFTGSACARRSPSRGGGARVTPHQAR